MANIFLDTNFFIDVSERDTGKQKMLDGHKVFVSPLSYHIFFYSYKHKVPSKLLLKYKDVFEIVGLSEKILILSLEGPGNDLEDNIQLHSAVEAECDIFLTNDKKLLKMKFFGKMKIASAF
ncbi:type II toxin-antitoxin system VapC family toxin [Candidatus Microgenomates bacterium]|nr:type II toxin-antitoxin system VapC family toxin [Candidatus Microgenomates bacterium]